MLNLCKALLCPCCAMASASGSWLSELLLLVLGFARAWRAGKLLQAV